MNENTSFEQIKQCIDEKKSFCFNAGAGSGKTYSLVQTVDYILKKYAEVLKTANQRIMVITYTNAAANEIINRTGATKLLDVSTIHTRMWELIKRFQTDLVSIHREKIERIIIELETKINQSTYHKDSTLNEYLSKKDFQDEFYKYRTLGAREFKEHFSKYISSGTILKGAFDDYVKNSIKRLKLVAATKKITDRASGFTRVNYDPLDNYDHLHKMKFSHDTLIEYSKILIEKSYTIKRIILDTYPYILVDEFQDTNPQIVSLLALLDSLPNNKCVIGYYGDSCQNIYEDGVGNQLNSLHEGLFEIKNSTNRRSAKSIVELANKIRKDSFSQCPYLNTDGSIQIYYSKSDDVDNFIDEAVAQFPSNEEIHCLVLKNDIVAERTGFGEFYRLIVSTKYYRERYNQISTEILNDDIKKLGKIPLYLYKWIDLYCKIQNPKTPVNKYISSDINGKINGYKLKQLRTVLKGVECKNLFEYASRMFELAEENPDIAKILKENIVEVFNFDIEIFKGYIFDELFSGLKDEELQSANDTIESLLKIDLQVMMAWYQYILRKVSTRLQFHTFHGTKGLEYKNVIIILTNEFNRKNDYFHQYFENYENETAYEDESFISKRNLLYVAVTRAKECLKLLYVDPNYDSVKGKFESVFGEIHKWTNTK